MTNERLRAILFLWGIRLIFTLAIILLWTGRELTAYAVSVVGIVLLAIVEQYTRTDK